MRILHTSDWHLGQYFIIKNRQNEHEKFLQWLIKCLQDNNIDLLIITGDIFDNATPPNYALQLYYNFLKDISQISFKRQHPISVIIIAGNHDSPATLQAPKKLLKLFNIYIIGEIHSDDNDPIVVNDCKGRPGAIVCPVPFLRKKDILKPMPGATYSQIYKAMVDGIKSHYNCIMTKGLDLKSKFMEQSYNIPLITTGHLFITGGQVKIDDAVYVGTLGQINASVFPKEFDYVALGHLHEPQNIKGYENISYAGSPIPLSFKEAGNQKQVSIIDFDNQLDGFNKFKVEHICIPEFQKVCSIKGDINQIESQIKNMNMPDDGSKIWIEIQLDSNNFAQDPRDQFSFLTQNFPIEILAIKKINSSGIHALNQTTVTETLHDLEPVDIFKKRISLDKKLDQEEANQLLQAFHEILEQVILGDK